MKWFKVAVDSKAQKHRVPEISKQKNKHLLQSFAFPHLPPPMSSSAPYVG